jgi:hypothetical protein
LPVIGSILTTEINMTVGLLFGICVFTFGIVVFTVIAAFAIGMIIGIGVGRRMKPEPLALAIKDRAMEDRVIETSEPEPETTAVEDLLMTYTPLYTTPARSSSVYADPDAALDAAPVPARSPMIMAYSYVDVLTGETRYRFEGSSSPSTIEDNPFLDVPNSGERLRPNRIDFERVGSVDQRLSPRSTTKEVTRSTANRLGKEVPARPNPRTVDDSNGKRLSLQTVVSAGKRLRPNPSSSDREEIIRLRRESPMILRQRRSLPAIRRTSSLANEIRFDGHDGSDSDDSSSCGVESPTRQSLVRR